MQIQIDLAQLISAAFALLVAFVGCVWVLGLLLAKQYDRRLSEQFKAQEDARKMAAAHWDERFADLLAEMRRDVNGWKGLERDFLKFQADLPLQYVRREDFMRSQTVIEAKLDGLALKIENIQLKGIKHD